MDRVHAEALKAFAAKAFERVGAPAADAAAIAELMAEADLQGSDGHGVFRLPQYIRRIQAGGVNPRPRIRIERGTSAPHAPPMGGTGSSMPSGSTRGPAVFAASWFFSSAWYRSIPRCATRTSSTRTRCS